MGTPVTIAYTYTFKNGMTKNFTMVLDRATLALQLEKRPNPPLWTLLTHKQCENCPLSEREHLYCPVALNFADIAEQFKDIVSHENVDVTVAVEERTYSKSTTIQAGLSPLIGIIMTTSGCPVAGALDAHGPLSPALASLDETIFRMTTMYLMAQYPEAGRRHAAWTLDEAGGCVCQGRHRESDFALRRDAAKKDANVNALVNLGTVAQMVPLAAEDVLREIKAYFSAYCSLRGICGSKQCVCSREAKPASHKNDSALRDVKKTFRNNGKEMNQSFVTSLIRIIPPKEVPDYLVRLFERSLCRLYLRNLNFPARDAVASISPFSWFCTSSNLPFMDKSPL
jgi:hypothetical protein